MVKLNDGLIAEAQAIDKCPRCCDRIDHNFNKYYHYNYGQFRYVSKYRKCAKCCDLMKPDGSFVPIPLQEFLTK